MKKYVVSKVVKVNVISTVYAKTEAEAEKIFSDMIDKPDSLDRIEVVWKMQMPGTKVIEVKEK